MPAGTYGSDVVAAGAYIMVMFYNQNTSETVTQFSFNHGVEFPAWTRRVFPNTEAKINLITDNLVILAVGAVEGEMQSMEYSMGEFAWKNDTRTTIGVPERIVTGMACASKPGLFLCVLTDSTQSLLDGFEVYTYATKTLAADRQWTRIASEDAPVTQGRMSVASDTHSFMMCGVEFPTRFLHCSITPNGIEPVVNTETQPTTDETMESYETRLSSNGVRGMYVLVYQTNGAVQTKITQDSGKTWHTANDITIASEVPSFLIYTDKFLAFHAPADVTSLLYLSMQNQTTPFAWEDPKLFPSGSTPRYSVAGSAFQDNYHIFYQNEAQELVVQSCIPTALPTMAPSTSPMSSSDAGMLSASTAMLLAATTTTVLGLLF